ncbi:hypothetical protein F1D59_16725 [Streptomyces sp. INR7]|nr:hypothetical protein F1D59_16725 [Streptomyces sp. INR7]
MRPPPAAAPEVQGSQESTGAPTQWRRGRPVPPGPGPAGPGRGPPRPGRRRGGPGPPRRW